MNFDSEGMKPTDVPQVSQEIVSSSNLEMILTKYSKNKTTSTEDTLLDTIQVPHNGKLKQIATKLPKSNYMVCSTEGNTSKNELSQGLHFSRNSISVMPNSNNKSMVVEMKDYNNSKNLPAKYLAKSIKPYRSETRRNIGQKDNILSHRYYGDISNEYSGVASKNYLSSRERRQHKRAESGLLKLKKLKADRVSLERYLEDNKMPKIITGKLTLITDRQK